MKPLPRNPERFEVIDLYAAIGKSLNLRIGDRAHESLFLKTVGDSLRTASQDKNLLFGKRTEVMFRYVAARLGRCDLIKQEDAGHVLSHQRVVVPDYRVVTKDGADFLVEVKNCHKTHIVFKVGYIEALRAYTTLVRSPIKFAVYWSQVGFWTLTDLDDTEFIAGQHVLTLEAASQLSQMGVVLGDGSSRR
jgi:hypothetical protein